MTSLACGSLRAGLRPGPGNAILSSVFKHCPQCSGEFQPWVTHCPDCGVALEAASGATPAPPTLRGLPPARELACVERGDPRHLHELAEQLQAQGVSCRIDVHPPDGAILPPARRGSAAVASPFGLYVLPADLEAAKRIRSEHLRRVIPDAGALGGEPGAVLADCPACGAALEEGATGCASCGLEFPELGADE